MSDADESDNPTPDKSAGETSDALAVALSVIKTSVRSCGILTDSITPENRTPENVTPETKTPGDQPLDVPVHDSTEATPGTNTKIETKHEVKLEDEIKEELKTEEIEIEEDSHNNSLELMNNTLERNLFETVGRALRTSSSSTTASVVAETEVPGAKSSIDPDVSNDTDPACLDGEDRDISESVVDDETSLNDDKTPVPDDNPSDETILNTEFLCKYCQYNAPNLDALTKHNLRTHDNSAKTFNCALCPFKYTTRDEILVHYKSDHRVKKLHICKECKYVSSNGEKYERHFKAHFLVRSYVCAICYNGYHVVNAYHQHMLGKHSAEERDSVNYKHLLKKRLRQTSDEKPEEPDTPATGSKRSLSTSASKSSNSESEPAANVSTPIKQIEVSIKDETPEPEPEPEPPYYTLPTKKIFLDCAFCGVSNSSKHDLATHLLSTHKDMVINIKDIKL